MAARRDNWIRAGWWAAPRHLLDNSNVTAGNDPSLIPLPFSLFLSSLSHFSSLSFPLPLPLTSLPFPSFFPSYRSFSPHQSLSFRYKSRKKEQGYRIYWQDLCTESRADSSHKYTQHCKQPRRVEQHEVQQQIGQQWGGKLQREEQQRGQQCADLENSG